MNYIGSKLSLLDFLNDSINDVLKKNKEKKPLSKMIFADLFAGTSCVGGYFKSLGCSIIANDIQYYSYVITKHMIENNGNLDKNRMEFLIDDLNNVEGKEGFIYKNYTYEGTVGQEHRRMYFTETNAKKCDAIRERIEKWLEDKYINKNEYFFLLGSLVNSIDKCANTASVYGAYLKKFKKSALRTMKLDPLPYTKGHVECKVFNKNANSLIEEVEGDILYLDPPYNERQYCANYHILETIAKNDNPLIKGKTGLRDYTAQKSDFCVKSKVCEAFEELIRKAKFRYIFLSYNNEGLMTLEQIKKIMSSYGDYSVYTKRYKRFKADNKRKNKSTTTTEYLHCLIKKK